MLLFHSNMVILAKKDFRTLMISFSNNVIVSQNEKELYGGLE